ncbi:IS110 family transposase [Rhodobacteraceae bacterium 2376]|uniref:IS110 family transposase n=1 Tax=Rhabdonatronobacter sediminivivens TaxID=2743469 RepID=A0A7Z0I3F0_9RHOB|nr:IS110 family transposase [Rhabdonatronobacter sediminivivens]NYS26762.1 IS110 family transposase [Rhabdonatronobacter sediminivivens]
MGEISTIGVDLAKSVFQLHGVDAEGRTVLRRQLRRSQILEFFQRQPPCLIGMEACASAHHWARELIELGHDVRLIHPSYVKGYVKRGKTDKADAEAICEAVSRPSMRFVPVKSEDTQALLMTHKAREFLVRQQTQIVNAMRAHLGEFGIVVAKGIHNIERLIMACEQASLPAPARKALRLLADQLVDTQEKIQTLTADIQADARGNEAAQRLQTIPGIGPITASALVAALPDIAEFKSGRDLSAWLGLTPRPHSTGGKERMGRISKMGNRYLRRLLYLGAIAQVSARRRRAAGEDWLWSIIQRKKPKQAAIALANRMARTAYALIKNRTEYRAAQTA